jgi:hypothetical protein
MSPASWLLWIVSLTILLLLLLVEWRREAGNPSNEIAQRRRATRFIVGLLLIIVVSVVAAIFLRNHETMDSSAQTVSWGTLGLLYFALIAGMVAQYFYFYNRWKFRWRTFIKPFNVVGVMSWTGQEINGRLTYANYNFIFGLPGPSYVEDRPLAMMPGRSMDRRELMSPNLKPADSPDFIFGSKGRPLFLIDTLQTKALRRPSNRGCAGSPNRGTAFAKSGFSTTIQI